MSRSFISLLFLFLGSLSSFGQSSVLRKLSPSVRHILRSAPSSQRSPGRSDCRLTAFVRLSDAAVLNHYGCHDLADFGDIHIVSLPLAQIQPFASDGRVLRVEAGRGTTALNHHNAEILNALPAYQGQQLPQAFTGRGVVVGIEDIGFDLTHPTFYSSDLQDYRIRALWDQLSTDTVGSRLPVGRDYVGRDALLDYAHSRDATIVGHGSHTLGTAAGSGYTSPYRGMAWESDLCLVANAVGNNAELIPEDELYLYTYATDALGFKYIFDYAESQGKPCVINFSEGSRQDLYGDDLLYYEVIHRLVGPGRILVASAGNNNLEPSYIHKPRGRESDGTFIEKWSGDLFFFASSDAPFTSRLVFRHGDEKAQIDVSSDWLCQQPDSLFADTISLAGQDYQVTLGAYPSCYDPDRLVVEYLIAGGSRLGMYDRPISAEFIGADADIEVYKGVGNFVSKPADPRLGNAQRVRDIVSPGSSPDVVCVGSTAYSTGFLNHLGQPAGADNGSGGLRAYYSSVGPTFDGRVKPDVMAPGNNIVSSFSSFFRSEGDSRYDDSEAVEYFDFRGRTYEWHADTGTSMATPAVAGAIALWLQAKPDLSPADVFELLERTCQHPDSSLQYPNCEYGYGQIDVYRGLLSLLGLDAIPGVSLRQPSGVKIRPREGGVEVSFAAPVEGQASVSIYSASGQRLLSAPICQGADRQFVPLAASGLYLVQVTGSSAATTGSTLVRL